MHASEANAVIEHKLMCSVRITIQVGLGPIVRISEVKTLCYFKVNKSDERIAGAIGYASAEHIIKNKSCINVNAKWLTFLGA